MSRCPQGQLFQKAHASRLFSAEVLANTKPLHGKGKKSPGTETPNYSAGGAEHCSAPVSKLTLQDTSLPASPKNSCNMLGAPLQAQEMVAHFLQQCVHFLFSPKTVGHFYKVSKIMKHLLLPLAFSYELTFKQV